MSYANWITRVGAYLIDALITFPIFLIGYIIDGPRTDVDAGTSTSGGVIYWILYVVGLAVWGYNRWWLAGKTGQSWGKKALSIWLYNEGAPQPIGPGKAFLRDLAHIIDSLICLIGYLFPLWDAKRQTLADKIVKTVVVKG